MATPRTSCSRSRKIGWLLGLLAVIIDVNLNAQEAFPPAGRPSHHVEAMASPNAYGPARTIDNNWSNRSQRRTQYPNPTLTNRTRSIFDMAPPLPRVSKVTSPANSVPNRANAPQPIRRNPAPIVDEWRPPQADKTKVTSASLDVTPQASFANPDSPAIRSELSREQEFSAGIPAPIVDRSRRKPEPKSATTPRSLDIVSPTVSADRALPSPPADISQEPDSGRVRPAPIVGASRKPEPESTSTASETPLINSPNTNRTVDLPVTRSNVNPEQDFSINAPAPIVDRGRKSPTKADEIAPNTLDVNPQVAPANRASGAPSSSQRTAPSSSQRTAPSSSQRTADAQRTAAPITRQAPVVDSARIPAPMSDRVQSAMLESRPRISASPQAPAASAGTFANSAPSADYKAPIVNRGHQPSTKTAKPNVAPAAFNSSPQPAPSDIRSPFLDDNSDVLGSIIGGETSSVMGNGLGGEAILPGIPTGYPGIERTRLFGAHGGRRIGEIQEPTIDPRYDRVLDLYGNDGALIDRVREAVEQTEVGVDTTEEQWISIRGDRITWGGRVEVDSVNWVDDEEFQGSPADIIDDASGQQDYVEFRRLRLFAAGEGYGVYDYQLELEFAENDVLVKDAYIGLSELPFLGYALIGHFRMPIGLENRTSTRNIPFMERSLTRRLLPGRDLGVALFNHTPSQRWTWTFGAFFDNIDEADKRRIDDNQGARAVGRVTWLPYYDEASLGNCFLHTGVGYVYTRPQFENAVVPPIQGIPLIPAGRRISFSARPEINSGDRLIDTGDLFSDQYHTSNVEMAYGNGPLTLQSELTWTAIENTGGTTTDLYGAYAYASWFITGERRPYDRVSGTFGRVIPFENFWVVHTDQGKRAGLGAWELGLRWSYLSFSEIENQYMHDLTLGINWYWNPNTRMMINWIHPVADNSDYATVAGEDAHGNILALRMAFDF